MTRALLLVLAVTAAVAVHGASGASPPTLYVSPTGSDGHGCTRSSPCATFEAALEAAAPGARVVVAGGSYPSQTLSASGRSGPAVTFAAAPGAKVVISDSLDVYASHVSFDRMQAFEWHARPGTTDLTFRGMKVQLFFIRSASHIRILGGSVGGTNDASAATLGSAYRSTVPARDVVIDGVSFHDVTRAAAPQGHVQCLFVQSVDGFVLRNSTFRHCDVFDVYVNNILDGPVPRNMLFENNLFDTASDGGFYSLYVRNDPGDTINRLVVRYNSFLQGPHFDRGSYTNSRVVGNVSPFPAIQCVKGIVFAHNVFDQTRCGPTDRRGALDFVDPDAFRLGLKRGAPGIDAGDRKDYPPRDIRGRRRPRGKAPDAGAYENA